MPSGTITVTSTRRFELIDITRPISQAVATSGCVSGVCHLYNPHTTAAVTINEGADPAVRDDLVTALTTIVPFNLPYQHQEGNSPAHVMATLVGSSATIFIEGGTLRLGTWQRIFFCEFDGARTRKLHWKILADGA